MNESTEIKHHKRGLRSVAIFEAFKGTLVLVVGLGLLSFIHRDLERVGERLVRFLHLDPAHHYPKIFLEALNHLSSTNIVLLAVGALAYSTLRLAEAYGLWYGRAWAEWLTIVSGGFYLPVEFYEMHRRYTHLKLLITLGNIAIVLYLLSLRFPAMRKVFRRAFRRRR